MNATCSSPFGLHIGAVIAFTTVLPMSHVTAIYAEWSGKINSQRYQLLSYWYTAFFLSEARHTAEEEHPARSVDRLLPGKK